MLMNRAMGALAASLVPSLMALAFYVYPPPLEWRYSKGEMAAMAAELRGEEMPDGGWPEDPSPRRVAPAFVATCVANVGAVIMTWLLGYGVVRGSRFGRNPGSRYACLVSLGAIVSATAFGTVCLQELAIVLVT